MIIHPKFVFLQMPKTACTTIEYFLIGELDATLGQTKHISAHRIEMWMLNVFKFGFIRNPYDWYVSWWASSDTELSFKDWMNGEKLMRPRESELLGIGIFHRDCSLMTLNFIFCYVVNVGKQGIIIADKIVKYEGGIAKQVDTIFDKFIFKLNRKQKDKLYSMDRLNASEHGPYQEYYDGELIERVKKQEGWLLARFGYEF